LPYVNIFFRNTSIGVTSDLNGNYTLTTTQPADSICASSVGYLKMTRAVKKGFPQVIDFAMQESMTELEEVQIRPEERWIELLMRRVFKSKDLNNPDQINYYQCEVYNKIQIDLNNLDSSFRDRKLFKPIDFVFDNLDTSKLNRLKG